MQEDVRLDDLENAGEEGQESIEIPSITPYGIKYEQAHVLGTHTLQTIICVSVMVTLNKETDIAMIEHQNQTIPHLSISARRE